MIAETVTMSLKWIDACDGQAVQTMAHFALFADSVAVWPVWGDAATGLEIFADDLLSYISEFWQPLTLRQTYPLSITAERPSQFRSEAGKVWGNLPEAEVERQEDVVSAFENAHDLARSFAGQFDLPSLWLLRQGSNMLIETSDRVLRVEFSQFIAMLSDVGDDIANRLGKLDGNKWARLIDRWQRRDQGDPDVLLAWSTGLSRESASILLKAGILRSASSVREVANDNDELRIAARMTGALPVYEIERVLRFAAGVPSSRVQSLDELSRVVYEVLTPAVRELLPFEQGVAAARRLREQAGVASPQRLEPFVLLRRYGIYYKFEHFRIATLDALAIWGNQHGPGMLLNLDSRRLALTPRREAAGNGAARVTAAHELCHLLFDRDRALGVVDILNGRMPLRTSSEHEHSLLLSFSQARLLPIFGRSLVPLDGRTN